MDEKLIRDYYWVDKNDLIMNTFHYNFLSSSSEENASEEKFDSQFDSEKNLKIDSPKSFSKEELLEKKKSNIAKMKLVKCKDPMKFEIINEVQAQYLQIKIEKKQHKLKEFRVKLTEILEMLKIAQEV